MPVYEEELSLEEIVGLVGEDIHTVKTITDIRIEKNGELFDFVNASVIVRQPGWVHMRVYKFGMLLRDIVMKEDELYILAGKPGKNIGKLMEEMYSAVFWWDHLEDAEMDVRGGRYIIRTPDRDLLVDRGSLLPVRQRIHDVKGDILIEYDDPEVNDGFRYQSRIHIYAGEFMFNVNVKKMIKNPAPGPMDFQTQPVG